MKCMLYATVDVLILSVVFNTIVSDVMLSNWIDMSISTTNSSLCACMETGPKTVLLLLNCYGNQWFERVHNILPNNNTLNIFN